MNAKEQKAIFKKLLEGWDRRYKLVNGKVVKKKDGASSFSTFVIEGENFV